MTFFGKRKEQHIYVYIYIYIYISMAIAGYDLRKCAGNAIRTDMGATFVTRRGNENEYIMIIRRQTPTTSCKGDTFHPGSEANRINNPTALSTDACNSA